MPERNIFTNPSFKGLYKFPGPVKDREDLYDSLRIHENVKSTK